LGLRLDHTYIIIIERQNEGNSMPMRVAAVIKIVEPKTRKRRNSAGLFRKECYSSIDEYL
jgi:hypothetical protein